MEIKRCIWCNLKNPDYIKYHDEEWGILNLDDRYLLEMLILESFQAGLSWECILNKRNYFQEAYDSFEIQKIVNYDQKKVEELLKNPNIIRNQLKIKASIQNAKVFLSIQKEYGSFHQYLNRFTKNQIFYETGLTHSNLSDQISDDLKKRGMTFVGTTIIYSYLQAIGIVVSHEKTCFLYDKSSSL